MWSTYTVEYYLVTEKAKILPLATTWMKPDIITLSETSQAQKFNWEKGLILLLLLLDETKDSSDRVTREERALFSGQRMEKWKPLLANQLCTTQSWGGTGQDRTGIMRQREKLRKGRDIPLISGNRKRSSRNLGATSFHSFYGLVLLLMVAAKCL
jgi:hypothetical protein